MEIVSSNTRSIVISGIVVAALAGMIVLAFLPMIGNKAADKIETRSYAEYQDVKKSDILARRPAPTITYNHQKWKSGDSIPIDQAFIAKDADGNSIPIKVVQIKDAHGNDQIDKYQDGAVALTAGSYFFKLQTIDAEKKVTSSEIALVVDN